MGKEGRALKFQLQLISKPWKLFLHSLLKNMSKIYFGPKQKRPFFQSFSLYVQSAAILISKDLTS